MADSNNEVKQDFFKGVKNEFKKISWPTGDLLAKETVAVVIISVVLGLIIALVDWVFQLGLGAIIK